MLIGDCTIGQEMFTLLSPTPWTGQTTLLHDFGLSQVTGFGQMALGGSDRRSGLSIVYFQSLSPIPASTWEVDAQVATVLSAWVQEGDVCGIRLNPTCRQHRSTDQTDQQTHEEEAKLVVRGHRYLDYLVLQESWLIQFTSLFANETVEMVGLWSGL